MKYSVVVPISDSKIYSKNLYCTLKSQQYDDYELIEIDSKQYGFISAAEAINSVADIVKGDYIIIVHQDVSFTDNKFFQKLDQCLDQYIAEMDFGVLGLAGKAKINSGKYEIVTKIVHTPYKTVAGTFSDFTSPVETESLDECLMIIKSTDLRNHPFIKFADTWHLYAHQYCIEMKHFGRKSYILPIEIWHNCKYGSFDINYFQALIKLCELYKKDKAVVTLYGLWPTNPIILRFKCLYRLIKLKMQPVKPCK